jgi:hypothetical protein
MRLLNCAVHGNFKVAYKFAIFMLEGSQIFQILFAVIFSEIYQHHYYLILLFWLIHIRTVGSELFVQNMIYAPDIGSLICLLSQYRHALVNVLMCQESNTM